MSQITFYRQKRFDEGLRTGIDIDGVEQWHHYIAGPDDGDSGILWYIDVALEGEALPDDPDQAHEWLVRSGPMIASALRGFAQRYDIGLDAGPYPQRWRIESLPDEVTGEIVVSAANRVEARQLGTVLVQLADGWSDALSQLDRMSHVA